MKATRGAPKRPVRPQGRYRGTHRPDNPWLFFGLVAAVPLVLVLLVVGFTALPPYLPSQAQAQPLASSSPSISPGPSGSPSPSVSPSIAPSPQPANAVAVQSYEAEDPRNGLGRSTLLRGAVGASGGRVVSRVGHGTPAGDVTFHGVVAATVGRYTITVSYVSTGTAAQRLALWVDGRAPVILTFPATRPAGAIGTLQTTVLLSAGPHDLRFGNATAAYGPDLDRITVGR